MPLPRRAAQVLDLMVQNGLGKRPIVFVCHSLGGLLAKQILRLGAESGTHDEKRSVFEQTCGMLFLATPHAGAALATLIDAFRVIFQSSVSVEDLREHDAHLEELFNWYRRHADGDRIRTITYYETRKIFGVGIVNPTSSHPGAGSDPVALDQDHISIAKPASRDAQVCKALQNLINRALHHKISPMADSVTKSALRPKPSKRPLSSSKALSLDELLFEIYDPICESAYHERVIDRDITSIIGHEGLWLSGPSGCGKTNALRRSLFHAGLDFEFIDLSRCVGDAVPELFRVLHQEIAERVGAAFDLSAVGGNGGDQSYHIGEIARLIERHLEAGRCIMIDEIPLDGDGFTAFAEAVVGLIVTIGNRSPRKAPLILASLEDPIAALRPFQTKIHERMKLLRLPFWSDAEVNGLVDLIAQRLPVRLTKVDKRRIIEAAKGSPRSVKIMLKQWCRFHNKPNWSLDRVIAELPISKYGQKT